MYHVIFLLWTFIAPDGTGQMIIKQEPSMEQCYKDGNELAKSSQEAVESKDLLTYTGDCHEMDIDITKGAA